MAALEDLVTAAAAAGTPLDPATVVAQLAADNPQLQALTRLVDGSGDGTVDPAALQALLAARRAPVDDEPTDSTAADGPDTDGDGAPGDGARDELVEMLERLWSELKVLRERNRRVADALGACARCWGERSRCPRCRGRGRPGGRDVDTTLFALLVSPAASRHEGQTDQDAFRIA